MGGGGIFACIGPNNSSPPTRQILVLRPYFQITLVQVYIIHMILKIQRVIQTIRNNFHPKPAGRIQNLRQLHRVPKQDSLPLHQGASKLKKWRKNRVQCHPAEYAPGHDIHLNIHIQCRSIAFLFNLII